MQNNLNITDRLREYQIKKYEGDAMKLKDVRFECRECKIHFTPGELRAKKLMDSKGVINECKECEEGNSDVY